MNDGIFDQPDVDFKRNFTALAERDIDFLLLEEFQVNANFVYWFCAELGLLDIKPDGAWHSVFDDDGETDLLIRVTQSNDKIGVLIENKIAAPEQPQQSERYHIRGEKLVKQGKLARFKTVLCAPLTYLNHREENGYDHSISYEQIAAWFAAQPDRRAAWRAHVIREAIAQSRRGYVMAIDPKTTNFHRKYWIYLQKHHPRILMTEPGDRGPRSTWIVLKGYGFPKGVHLNHKINANLMELAFSKTKKADLVASRPDWPDDLIMDQKGDEATIALITQKIDIWSDFDDQIAVVEEALNAAEKLMQYATVLEKSVTLSVPLLTE